MKRSSPERGDCEQTARLGRGQRIPGLPAQLERGRCEPDLWQLAKLLRRQLAEPAEVRDPDMLADLAQRHLGVRAQPREDLGELKLVVEIGLKPQAVVAAVLVQRPVTRRELA